MHSAWQRYTRKPWVASASRFNKLFNPSSAGLSACSSCSQINEGRQPGVNTSVSMEALSLGDEWWPTFFFLSFLGKFGWLSYKTWKQKPTRFSLGRRQTLCSWVVGNKLSEELFTPTLGAMTGSLGTVWNPAFFASFASLSHKCGSYIGLWSC